MLLSPVEESIRSAELGLKSDSKKQLQESSVETAPAVVDDDDDALMMQSFYERHSRQSFPPLPTNEWKSLFPNLRLSNERTRTEAALAGKDNFMNIRMELKGRLQQDLSNTFEASDTWVATDSKQPTSTGD